MNDKGRILLGLLVFLILITFPVWYNIVKGKVDYRPDVQILTANTPGKDVCVEDTDYMREKHMDLLNVWREKVVREGERVHVSPDGKKYNMSLSYTCLDCHSNKADFCDQCHNYMAVQPYCWECHLTTDDADLKSFSFFEPVLAEVEEDIEIEVHAEEDGEHEVATEEAH